MQTLVFFVLEQKLYHEVSLPGSTGAGLLHTRASLSLASVLQIMRCIFFSSFIQAVHDEEADFIKRSWRNEQCDKGSLDWTPALSKRTW